MVLDKNHPLLHKSPARSILTILLNGRNYTAKELACMSFLDTSTAAEYLNLLTGAMLVTANRYHGHRYYRINNLLSADVRSVLSAFHPEKIHPLKQSAAIKKIAGARTCYTHLAGKLGVALTESMVQHHYLKEQENEQHFTVTTEGEQFFTACGLHLPSLQTKGRPIAPFCLDRTERRHHLAGTLGQALTAQLFARGWIKRMTDNRAVFVTPSGKIRLNQYFGITTQGILEGDHGNT